MTTRPGDSQLKKRTSRTVDVAVPTDNRVKQKESEKRDKYLDLARELKKTMEHSDGDTNCILRARYSHQRIGTGPGGVGNKEMKVDHPGYSIAVISQNTTKSPGDLRTHAVTQTLTLVGRTLN